MTISENDDVLGTIHVLQTLFKRLSHADSDRDGIIDARNPADERYGADRLTEVVKSCAEIEAEALAATIMNQVLTFQGDAPQFDYITLLVAAIE